MWDRSFVETRFIASLAKDMLQSLIELVLLVWITGFLRRDR
jgi:hypothetical protein